MSFPHTFLTSLRLLSISYRRQRSHMGRIMYTSTGTGVPPRPSGASLSFDDARRGLTFTFTDVNEAPGEPIKKSV